MPKITVNPSDIEDLKTPLYKKDNNKVYRLLPETTADQVALTDGRDAQTAINKLNSDVVTAQSTADTANTTANAVKTAVENTTTGLAATKAIADAAKTKADSSVQLAGNQTISGVKTFSASPIIPTPSETDNSTKAATTAFVRAMVSALVNSAPETLDTLKELADALGNDPNFATTIATQIGNIASTANAAKSAADSASAAAVVMTGATASASGTAGLAPAPEAGSQTKYLCGDGTWQTPPDNNTTYSDATQSAAGLMSAADKTKLDGIAAGATNTPAVTVGSLFPNYDASPEFFATFDNGWLNPGYIGVADAKALLKPTLAELGGLPLSGGTMTGPTIFPIVDYRPITLKNNYDVYNETPTATKLYPIDCKDKNGNFVGQFAHSHTASGVSQTYLHTVGENGAEASLGVLIAKDGTTYGFAPNPPAAATGATIITANWARNTFLPLVGGVVNGHITLQGSSPALIETNTNDSDFHNAPASQIVWWFSRAFDAKNQLLGDQYLAHNTDGAITHNVRIYNQDGSKFQYLSFIMQADGTSYVNHPTPLATSNTTHSATTHWVRERISAATGKGATTFSLGNPEASIMTLSDGIEACSWNKGMITPDMKEAALSTIKETISNRIFSGFIFEINGNDYIFTYDLYDQQNLSDNAILAMQGIEDVYVSARENDTGELVDLFLSPQQALTLHRYGVVDHKQAIMKYGSQMREEVDACTTYSQLELLLEDFGLLYLYNDYLNSKIDSYSMGIPEPPDEQPNLETEDINNNIMTDS